MVTSRRIKEEDRTLIQSSIANDEYHNDNTNDSFFYQKNAACNVYFLDNCPVLFLRVTKSLRVDIQFIDNNNHRDNAAVLLDGFQKFINSAKENGFTEIVFNSLSPLLVKFCKDKFGYEELPGELRLKL